jgi:hypothetical protein
VTSVSVTKARHAVPRWVINLFPLDECPEYDDGKTTDRVLLQRSSKTRRN